MKQDLSSRPDLVSEVRLKVPLVIAIPLAALGLIAVVAILFAAVLLELPSEAATIVAIVTAANILGACAFLALRPPRGRAPVLELALVAFYPVLIGLVIAQAGIGAETEAVEPPTSSTQQAPQEDGAATDEIAAADLAFDADTIELAAGEPNDFTLDNQDTATHNLVIFESEETAVDPNAGLFTSPDAPAGEATDFTIDPLDRGEYYFRCAYHETMNGAVEVS